MLLLRNCVRVAQQTLTLYVWVRILVPQPNAPKRFGAVFVNIILRYSIHRYSEV